jgi:hypothetical protein
MYGKKNPGPIGVSPGATVGDMIENTRRMQKPSMPKRPEMRRVNEDMLRTTVDFRPSLMPRGRMR